jgi:hypothetical protein
MPRKAFIWTMPLAVAALSLLSVARSADSGWDREPSTVFGIALGEPFPSAGEVPDCPLFAPFRREPQYEGMCVDAREGYSADRLLLRNVPMSGLAHEAEVTLRGGRVVAVVVPFEAVDFEPMEALLVARLGPAHTATHGRASWRGPRVEVTLRQIAGGSAGRPSVEFRLLAAP